MDSYLSFSKLREQERSHWLDETCSHVQESYLIFRRKDNSIQVHKANLVLFDQSVSLSDNISYTLDCDVELSLLSDDDCARSCGALLTEYKQIKEYEDKIKELTNKLNSTIEERNKWWSKQLHTIDSYNNLQHQKIVLDAVDRGDMFALFVDEYSESNVTSIMIVPLSQNNKFFTSDYWTKLFTKNERWTFVNFWDPPHVTFDKMGCNHCFVVCDAKSYNDAIHHLLWYPNDKYELILSDEGFMYNKLNEIWKLTFGTEHGGESNVSTPN